LRAVEDALMGRGGESMMSEALQRHIITRVTDEGLVVELFSLPGSPLFDEGEGPTVLLEELSMMVARVAELVTNDLAVVGHVRARPVVLADNPVWELSASRADRVRRLLDAGGLDHDRMRRVTGHADRKPAVTNRMAPRNDRIEIVFLRY
jgi:chemotaxis protein MotB